jgi:large subunit ribosomal protein L11
MTRKQKDRITAQIKLTLKAGKATPANPVGPTLGGYGMNLGAMVREYNDRTAHYVGMKVPVIVTIYSDRSFSLEILQPTTASLLRRAAGIEKGSQTPGRVVAGQITAEQLCAIAEQKMGELNARDLEGAMRTIAGTARSMGIAVPEDSLVAHATKSYRRLERSC